MAAREAFAKKGIEAIYYDVKGADADKLATMLSLSGGKRKVPVIVDAGKVTVGFGGS